MNDREALRRWADRLGVGTHYTDGLGRPVEIGAETLAAICAALGAPLEGVSGAARAYREHHDPRRRQAQVEPIVLAWDGRLAPVRVGGYGRLEAALHLEDGTTLDLETLAGTLRPPSRLPFGIHGLTIRVDGLDLASTVISAPIRSWRRPGALPEWGVGTHLAALRSRRSRSVADLVDLRRLCAWAGGLGADLVTVLPLLPTFNEPPPEPSPYSPVSRLFWSELILDLGAAHTPVGPVARLDVTAADREVRRALADLREPPDPRWLDDELRRYASFRGAQRRMGRNWRDWPTRARAGTLDDSLIDAEERHFHETAQLLLRQQLHELRGDLDRLDVRLGLDLAVGAHPDGYDAWSRQELFAPGMAVGAPPDPGFPAGQDWGFAPVLPSRSRAEGHRYLAACIAHQASVAGVLRLDHVMAFSRLYWIPHGFDLSQGAYVSYPADELFALLTLVSHRHRCEIVGEDLGTVPDEIREALPRHGIRSMYLSIFEATKPRPRPPTADQVAFVGSHDTPTFVGWLEGRDIRERVRCGLLADEETPAEFAARAEAIDHLVATLGGTADEPGDLLARVLAWLGESDSPLVLAWLEDLWLEPDQVNLPGTPSSARPNWQRPMSLLLEELMEDDDVRARLEALRRGRRESRSRVDGDR